MDDGEVAADKKKKELLLKNLDGSRDREKRTEKEKEKREREEKE